MSTTERKRIRKEEKKRRKKLLRAFREDEQAKHWNAVADEVGLCNLDNLRGDYYTFDFLDRVPDSEFMDPDEDYPNKVETMHNIFECG